MECLLAYIEFTQFQQSMLSLIETEYERYLSDTQRSGRMKQHRNMHSDNTTIYNIA